MKPTVYIETTIISYLAARPSRDLVQAGRQRTTSDWWHESRQPFTVLTSELVLMEAETGDVEAAAKRLQVLADFPVLPVTEVAEEVAAQLVGSGAVPTAAPRDALHIGVCAAHGIEFLLTWNFRHLANAALRHKIRHVCLDAGCVPPDVCTPDELMECES